MDNSESENEQPAEQKHSRCTSEEEASTITSSQMAPLQISDNANLKPLLDKKFNHHPELKSIPWKIYVSRFLSAWGDRSWAFGAGIFMVELAPENLRLVAIYGLVLCVSVIIFGAPIGNWIDKNPRLKAASVFLALQNSITALTCIIIGCYFAKVGHEHWPPWIPDVVPYVSIGLAAMAQLASVGTEIVVEKDWIVVIAMGNDDRLAQINAVFRTIDLTTLTLAPLTAGLVFDLGSTRAAAHFLAAWNLVSVIFEYLLLKSIYHEYPQLSRKKIFEEKKEDYEEVNTKADTEEACNPLSRLVEAFQSWIMYMKYPIRNAGLGLACLYMTVLGFDNITYGYCVHQCVRESLLGGLVGIAALNGVFGSLSFPLLRKRLGLAKTGLVGYSCLIAALCICVVSIWTDGSPFDPHYFIANHTLTTKLELADCDDGSSSYSKSVIMLMSGIIAGKFGLWLCDLTITQILQEKVPEEHRGTIGGVQNALNSAMDTIKLMLVIALPNQETFGWIILASFCSICTGAALYASYALQVPRRQSPKSKNKFVRQCRA